MKENPVREFLKGIPIRVLPPVRMDQVNQVLPVYKGNFFLVQDQLRWEIQGEINFVWFPDTGLKFSGTILHGKAFEVNFKNKISLETAEMTPGAAKVYTIVITRC